jgi:hypothetical protein
MEVNFPHLFRCGNRRGLGDTVWMALEVKIQLRQVSTMQGVSSTHDYTRRIEIAKKQHRGEGRLYQSGRTNYITDPATGPSLPACGAKARAYLTRSRRIGHPCHAWRSDQIQQQHALIHFPEEKAAKLWIARHCPENRGRHLQYGRWSSASTMAVRGRLVRAAISPKKSPGL